jgi:hypothetical protein
MPEKLKMDAAMNYIDEIYEFKGKWDVPSKCGIRIIKTNEKHIVIATDFYDENPGSSVTSFCCELADMICRDFSLDPKRLVFIEHCPDRGSSLDHYKETFDIVSFRIADHGFADPDWKRITREDLDLFIK